MFSSLTSHNTSVFLVRKPWQSSWKKSQFSPHVQMFLCRCNRLSARASATWALMFYKKNGFLFFSFFSFDNFFFNIFNWRLMTSQYCSGFAIHWHESATGVYMCSPSWLSLPPPSPSHPSASSQCSGPEHPVSCIEPGLATVSHMIIYMFQCYSLRSCHPRLLPQSPKDCSIHLCLFCHLSKEGYCYHLSKFHMYALVYCIGVFLSGLLHSV